MRITENIKFILDSQHSTGGEKCPNMLIKGDNRAILPELIPIFQEKIKCVYIDPPYNNGDSYHYYEDNLQSSLWLRELRIVLMYLKQMLSRDGSIWISIDDGEMAYLKVEADKIFGRDNFAGTIVWQQRKTRENRAVFSCNHEYILVYAKDLKVFRKTRNLLVVGEDFISSKYRNPDQDPRGVWQSVSASVQAGHGVSTQFYTIVSPSGKCFSPPKGRCWVYNQARMQREIADNNIWFGKDGNHTPRVKKFLSGSQIGLTPETLWSGDRYGTTDSAKKHLLQLFPEMEHVFDTPKPEELIRSILEIATNEGDYVLDCFLGSGTTITAAHKMKRRYIGIECGDQMTELVVRRLQAVIEGEPGGISKDLGWQGGGEYVYFNFDANRQALKQKSESSSSIITPEHQRQLSFLDRLHC
ncbi:MAG: site-specific DNA-methyltransferase [Oligosphaeraceae bacterium]